MAANAVGGGLLERHAASDPSTTTTPAPPRIPSVFVRMAGVYAPSP